MKINKRSVVIVLSTVLIIAAISGTLYITLSTYKKNNAPPNLEPPIIVGDTTYLGSTKVSDMRTKELSLKIWEDFTLAPKLSIEESNPYLLRSGTIGYFKFLGGLADINNLIADYEVSLNRASFLLVENGIFYSTYFVEEYGGNWFLEGPIVGDFVIFNSILNDINDIYIIRADLFSITEATTSGEFEFYSKTEWVDFTIDELTQNDIDTLTVDVWNLALNNPESEIVPIPMIDTPVFFQYWERCGDYECYQPGYAKVPEYLLNNLLNDYNLEVNQGEFIILYGLSSFGMEFISNSVNTYVSFSGTVIFKPGYDDSNNLFVVNSNYFNKQNALNSQIFRRYLELPI